MDPLAGVAHQWRAARVEAAHPEADEDLPGIVDDLIRDKAEEIEARHGTAAGVRFFRRVMASDLLEDHFDEWLRELHATEKTLAAHRQAKQLLLAHHTTVSEIDRRVASDFVRNVLVPGRLAPTVNKLVSTYSGLWRWLRKRGRVKGENPWTDQRVSEKVREGDRRVSRKPMPEREGAELIAAIDGKRDAFPADPDVLRLVAVTGARLEEVCSLAAPSVSFDGDVAWVHIQDGKTKAAARRIPVIEPGVVTMLRRRVSGGGGGPLFPELTADKNGDRSPRISQRLGRALRTITKNAALTAAHSWRHRAATLMEQCGIPLSTMEAVLGHKRTGESLGRYSAGPADAQLIGAVRPLTIPTPPPQAGEDGAAGAMTGELPA